MTGTEYLSKHQRVKCYSCGRSIKIKNFGAIVGGKNGTHCFCNNFVCLIKGKMTGIL